MNRTRGPEDGLLERARVGVAEVLEQVQQVDTGLTHGGSPRMERRSYGA